MANAHASLREMFDAYARMTVKTGLSFDGLGGQNVIMDISEVCSLLSPAHAMMCSACPDSTDVPQFSRWAHEYGLVPKYLSLEKMKSIFREANVGDHSDEYRHTFDYEEFVYCVRRCVNEVMIACGDGAVPARILHLRTLLAGGEEDEPVSREMAMASTMSANLMTAYDNDNASDGVRVPVSTLWSSVREVESHLQTEEQLRAALDRLAGQLFTELHCNPSCRGE